VANPAVDGSTAATAAQHERVAVRPELVSAVRAEPVEARTTLEIQDLPGLELVNVRGDANDAVFAQAIHDALGITLPSAPNTVTIGATHDALWLAPDEWLLQSRGAREPTLARTLTPAFDGTFATAVDLSSAYVVFALHGAAARRVLNAGCPLDLHPRVFTEGRCAQSHFYKADVIVRALSPDTLHAVFRRSFIDYVCDMLVRAARNAQLLRVARDTGT
jgi:sarcosine oxidase, subunit gamma